MTRAREGFMRRLATAVCVLPLLLAEGAALGAPGPSAEDRGVARALADKGAALFEEGKYEESIELFRKADERVHAPTFVLAIAQAYAKLGKLIEAREHYEKVVNDSLPPAPPQSFIQAQATAKSELEGLLPRIPTLQIVLTGAAAGGATVTIDGAPAPALDQPIAQNPGDHQIVATPAAGPAVTRSVSLREGANERVEIALTPPNEGKDEDSSKGSLVPAAVALGVGVVGLGVGAITGAMALGQVSDIKAQCTSDNVCPKTLEADATSAGTLADTSTACFIIGGVGVAAGVVLFFLRPGGGSSKAPEAPASARALPRPRAPVFESVQASFGPGSVRISGRF